MSTRRASSLLPRPSVLLPLALLLPATLGVSGSLAAQSAPTPLAAVHRFFDGMRAHDSTAIRATLDPLARLLTTGERDGRPFVAEEAIEPFLATVAGAKESLDERLRAPEVRIDAGLATVWARYDFYAGGRLSHCGVDAFQLARTEAGWRITQVMDTRHRTGCR